MIEALLVAHVISLAVTWATAAAVMVAAIVTVALVRITH